MPRKECTLPVKVGEVHCVLLDEKEVSDEIKTTAYLALTDRIPVILGFQDILTKFQLFCNQKDKEAYLERKKIARATCFEKK